MKQTRSQASLLLGLSFLLLALSGCGGGGQFAKVSGKVTLKDKLVPGGTVIFANQDFSKVERVPIQPDGTYSSSRVPYGDLKIGVEPAQKGAASLMPKGANMPKIAEGGPADVYAKKQGAYVNIPTVYRDPKTSPLKVTIDSPEKTLDLPLTP